MMDFYVIAHKGLTENAAVKAQGDDNTDRDVDGDKTMTKVVDD